MVILIGIGEYDQEPNDNTDFHGHVDDLDFIDLDIKNGVNLFQNDLKYKVYPKYDINNIVIGSVKLSWTKEEIIQFLMSKSEELSDNINKNKNYDGLIVIFSGHGLKGNILTSDYGMISKDLIQRIFSKAHNDDQAINRNIPRLFIFDCCEGNYGKDNYVRSTVNEGIGVDLIPKMDIDTEWANNEDHPDYNLIVINSTTKDFVALGNLKKGSLFLTKLIKKMKENNVYCHIKNAMCLEDIFDNVQDELHKQGKQLPVSTFYNGKLKKLMFVENANSNETCCFCCKCCENVKAKEDVVVVSVEESQETELVNLKHKK